MMDMNKSQHKRRPGKEVLYFEHKIPRNKKREGKKRTISEGGHRGEEFTTDVHNR